MGWDHEVTTDSPKSNYLYSFNGKVYNHKEVAQYII